jgi:hypothetical protein
VSQRTIFVADRISTCPIGAQAVSRTRKGGNVSVIAMANADGASSTAVSIWKSTLRLGPIVMAGPPTTEVIFLVTVMAGPTVSGPAVWPGAASAPATGAVAAGIWSAAAPFRIDAARSAAVNVAVTKRCSFRVFMLSSRPSRRHSRQFDRV